MKDEKGANTRTLAVRAREKHRLLSAGTYVDPFSGEEWLCLFCPRCGRKERVQWEPYRSVIDEKGEGDLTEEEIAALPELCKQGPVGRAKAQAMLSKVPGHVYVKVPTEEELRVWSENAGAAEEFREAVEQATLQGRPLLEFGIEGIAAAVYPKGVRPANTEKDQVQ